MTSWVGLLSVVVGGRGGGLCPLWVRVCVYPGAVHDGIMCRV